MIDNLFKRAAVFGDIHYGRNGNNPIAICDNIDYIEWFIDEARTRDCETCIFVGDWHHNRHSLHISTMHASLNGMQRINDSFEKTYWIPGNHDLFYRDRRDVNSVEFARYLPNIRMIRDPKTMQGVTFLPWLVGDEGMKLRGLKSRYVFAHLEVPGFLMNAKVEMPDSSHAVKPDSFPNQEMVFSGHFHMRQTKDRICYIGNVMPFDFSDNWDTERGAMFLEWGKDPEFAAWPDQPLFRTMKLSELLNEPDRLLRPKLTARVSIDIEISYEEAQVVKEEFMRSHNLRKIEMVHQQKQEAEQDFSGDTVFQSVDQIVIDGLLSVQSTGLKPETLVEIYKGLGSL